MTLQDENVTCPFCGGIASIHDLGRAGLSAENLQELMGIVQAGQAPEMLFVWRMFQQRNNPESASTELSTVKAIDSLREKLLDQHKETNIRLTKIETTWNGIGKGKVSEILVANELHQLFPEDKFDQSKSNKKVDILAIVDKNNEVGKICISVKETEKWNKNAITQLEENMKQENTKWGILVSKKLPAGIPPAGKVVTSEQGCYVLVHFENLSSIYTVLREYVIGANELENESFTKEQQLLHIKEISQEMASFIESEEYKEISKQIGLLRRQIDALETDVGDMESSLKNCLDKMRGRFQKMRLNITKVMGVHDKIKKIFHTP